LTRLAASLSRADRALGRLDGATRNLPDANLFLAMYVRQESLLSSQIEGTECTLDDLLSFQLDAGTREIPDLDVQEVVNYVAALNLGMKRLADLPISRRLLCEIQGCQCEGKNAEIADGSSTDFSDRGQLLSADREAY
jgi:Fic family protein